MSKTGPGKAFPQTGNKQSLLAIDLLDAKTTLIIDWDSIEVGAHKNYDLFYSPDHNLIFCESIKCRWWSGGLQYWAVVVKGEKRKLMTGLYVGGYVIHQYGQAKREGQINWD